MKKSIIFIIISILVLLPIFSISASAEYYNNHLAKMDIRSVAYYLVNTDTETVVFSQNADQRLKCASLVKIATAVVVVENCDNLDSVVTATESALKPLEGTYSSSCDLVVGEEMTVRDLLYCLFLESANDAANVLAEYIGGSIDEFVVMMNDFAKRVGCENTNFTNPHGLDEENEYSSARDVYLMTRAAMEYALLTDIGATVEYTVPPTNMTEARELNTSADIIESGSRYYYEYAHGFKTGFTSEAARCVSAIATKDAYTYVGVILGCPNECVDKCQYPDNTALYEVRRMFRWAFGNMLMSTVAEATDIIADVPVSLSTEADHVVLVPEKRIQALLLDTVNKSSLEFVYTTEENVQAPVEKGDVLGTVQVKYADSVIAQVNLVAGNSVSRSSLLYAGHIAKGVVSSPVFLIILGVIIVGVIAYFSVVYSRYNKRKVRSRKELREIKERNLSAAADLNEVSESDREPTHKH